MKKKAYFLIFSFLLICLVANSSYAQDNHIKESDLEDNMLIKKISTNNENLVSTVSYKSKK